MSDISPSRSGGRAARRAARNAPLAQHLRPIRPGLEGGTYKPLSEADMQAIHRAALEALEEIGLADAPPSGVAYLTGAGAILGDDGRIRFPRALVEDTLAMANRQITLCARDPAHDLELGGNRVHFGTAGAAVHMVDAQGRNYRECGVQDLHDAARICDTLDNIHFVQRPMVCRDIPDNQEMDLNTIFACCSGTTKHIGTSFTEPSFVPKALEMLHMIAGGEDKWRERPFMSNSNCFVVPPMKFATESCEVMEAVIEGGMPVLLLSAGMAGATAPSTVAGAIVQAVAECLAGLVYVNAVKPGHPAIFGTWPFGLDLRSGAMTGGSGEQALLTAGCAQMHKFYGVPGGAAAGIADSKLPDMQAGWEQMCSNVMAGLSGCNMIYEAAGMHASLLGFCHESLILGDDLIGQALRCVRGIEVNDETLALDQMREVCLGGPGHYLGTEQTLSRMEQDHVYPALGDRSSPKEWDELGKPDLIEKATARKDQILGQRSAASFDPMLEKALREAFPIHLPVQ
ncbi:trimethylamine methyltransferase family protein [Sulfitobacter mediterraneus]|uniref:trimethylamine methyltransferase family protein n=1 Tax=Sulfitobacter mediterraneus TaxID=83219 RepID=UPI0019311EAA|nr:trimethylamine methyltransferase family protein [Sulfitobacter mediterraneus]MBM1309193.1 trimethylamine methyltransferase family protein [Sulfitobacter mediterraneus]MBM1313078.1 trimethylamine methyltransferase family protein [Sulfitobacter mediterraneus]MBM1321462.1 trimethylamine methyltransferase family protein [Sulfitobacter mediterraneus]MBM1325349.1 trimethylamine methyltransferase family protein [Sulfitobacter mediterraneus]MBM1396695.1 trimethylamine methyltransferase family prote